VDDLPERLVHCTWGWCQTG